MSDKRIGVGIFSIPVISTGIYLGVSLHIEPSSSYIDNYWYGLIYLLILVTSEWNSSEEREHRPIPLRMVFGFLILYILYYIVFSHNIYILSFHYILYAILIIILQETFLRNIIIDTRIEVKGESLKESNVFMISLLVFLTIFLFFMIFLTYSFQLDFTGSFVDFLQTPPIVVSIITYTCVVAYNYLMFRRLLSHAEYIEGSDD